MGIPMSNKDEEELAYRFRMTHRIPDIRAEIDAAIARTTAHADPLWLKEMLVCTYIAALENEFFQVDDVWAVFDRRKKYQWPVYNKTALGGIIRLAAGRGWIEKVPRPEGLMSVRNHNSAGTSYWHSKIFGDPIRRIPDCMHCSFMHPAEGVPQQLTLC